MRMVACISSDLATTPLNTPSVPHPLQLMVLIPLTKVHPMQQRAFLNLRLGSFLNRRLRRFVLLARDRFLLARLLVDSSLLFHVHAQLVHSRPCKRTGMGAGVWHINAAQQAAGVDRKDAKNHEQSQWQHGVHSVGVLVLG